MKFRYFSTAAAALAIWSVSAQAADIREDIDTLVDLVDEKLCNIENGIWDSDYCVADFVGEFGSSTDLMQPDSKKDRERSRTNRKWDLSCDGSSSHPIEDPYCNETASKAEWRHDSLKLKLESADQSFDQGKDAAGVIYMCTFASDIYAMVIGRAISPEGYEEIVNRTELLGDDQYRGLADILEDAGIPTVPTDDYNGVLCDE